MTPRQLSPVDVCDLAAATYCAALPELVANIQRRNDHAQIRYSADGVELSFTGSNDLGDWLSNMDMRLVPHPVRGHVHSGFLHGWLNLKEDVMSVLADYAHIPIHIAGHSRGGAIAQSAALDIAHQVGNRVETLTTLASPRNGDELFCASLEEAVPRITRYETRTLPIMGLRDLVPHLPSARYGFTQPGRVVYLLAFGWPLHQHDIATYRRALKKRQAKPVS